VHLRKPVPECYNGVNEPLHDKEGENMEKDIGREFLDVFLSFPKIDTMSIFYPWRSFWGNQTCFWPFSGRATFPGYVLELGTSSTTPGIEPLSFLK
jgi:hypothetical protein